MIDKRTNILVVAGFTILFTVTYLYNFFGTSWMRFNQEDILQDTISDTMIDGNLYFEFQGNLGFLLDILTESPDIVSGAEEIQSLPFAMDSITNQFSVSGAYNYNSKDNIHTILGSLVDPSSFYELLNLSLLHDGDRLYFMIPPIIEDPYFYESKSSSGESELFSDLKDNIDMEDMEASFVKHKLVNGKDEYLYRIQTSISMSETDKYLVEFFVKPNGGLREIIIGEDDASLSIIFDKPQELLSYTDFDEALQYDSDKVVEDLLKYTEGLIQ